MRTGRRENPAVNGPRDKTVCFMLSEQEKHAVDRLSFCVHLTRSGLLAKVVAAFIEAADSGKRGKAAEKQLIDYLGECRRQLKRRGAFADKTINEMRKSA